MSNFNRAKPALSLELIVATAIRMADADGLDRLSMRRLGQELSVEAMSLYHHLRDKDALLDAMIDVVFVEIEIPTAPSWRDGLRQRADSQRAALHRHRWALQVLESRSHPGLATLQHHDQVLGYLRAAGFGVRATGSVFSLIDAYVFGFLLTELQLPFDADSAPAIASDLLPLSAQFPHFGEYLKEVILAGPYDYAEEFHIGLEVVLDAAERLRT
jgi:AcrR family transcriptional regulator